MTWWSVNVLYEFDQSPVNRHLVISARLRFGTSHQKEVHIRLKSRLKNRDCNEQSVDGL